ncbi:Scarecrow-like protein 21 [Apostasia shenzhenica]|uniref:Scarecrow-like protein 21 n=1 Tax=Apostasia shenzhenica TaxID=1088818 RepID=A0A2H9ZUK4_9ASPA|nr:Scarecrow-like protein 21 [Apostasia shenzhenica]
MVLTQEAAGEHGLQLIRRLLLCASAVDSRDFISAAHSLLHLYRNVSVSGDPFQRVAAYFTDGLAARILTANSPFYTSIMAKPSPADEFAAFTAFYRDSPYYQFAHFTANQAIIEAFEEAADSNGGSLHVVDFDVGYGLQWPSLIQSLSDMATRENPISLKITGFGRGSAELRETETRLSGFAAGCRNLRFEFEGRMKNQEQSMIIKVNQNATLAVNLVFYLHTLKNYAEISSALQLINAMNPSIVTLVEKEGTCRKNQPGFLSRFMEYLHFFAAMFDSLEDCLPAESKERLEIERNHLGMEIKEAVLLARGGVGEGEGLNCESLERWKEVMRKNGFEGKAMSSRSVSQAKLLLKIKNHCSAMAEHGSLTGFRISERDEGKAISLGWQYRHLITATAWRPLTALEV